jgi:hypothetical protein
MRTFRATSPAGSLCARGSAYASRSNYYDYLLTFRRVGNYGAAFEYKAVKTEVLRCIMKRVTCTSLAGMNPTGRDESKAC